ncbi:MAG: hypothetical protein ACI4ET_11240 [Bilifractor sp.]
MIQHIYFDMDGVLADFDRGVRELCQMEPVEQGSGKKADDALWTAVAKVDHFYDRLEPKAGAVGMFQALYRKFGNKCEILTGISKPHRHILNAGEDKTNWVHRLLGPDVKVHIVYREEKPDYCKGKDDILIDDYPKNIREWKEIGGTGILFESPEKTLQMIEDID